MTIAAILLFTAVVAGVSVLTARLLRLGLRDGEALERSSAGATNPYLPAKPDHGMQLPTHSVDPGHTARRDPFFELDRERQRWWTPVG
jgi:hypothetical protein